MSYDPFDIEKRRPMMNTAHETRPKLRLMPPSIAAILALALCVIAPGAVMAATSSSNDPAGQLSLAVLLIAGLRLSWLIGLGDARLLEFAFWTFTYVFMGLAPLAQIRSDNYAVAGLTTALNLPTMLIVLVGTLCVLAGTCVPRNETNLRDRANERLNTQRVLALSAFALILDTYFIWKIGPAVFLESRDSLSQAEGMLTDNQTDRSILVSAATVPLLVSFHAIIVVRRSYAGGVRQLLTLLTAMVGVVALFTVNPISSPRYLFGTFILSMAAGLGAYRTPGRVRVMALSFLAALVAVFPIADVFRHSAEGTVDAVDGNLINSLTSADFDAYGQLNNTLLYVHDLGLTWGRQATGVFLFWIPRSIWSTKPSDTGTTLAEFRGYTFTNMSAPIWAELYINIGTVGVIVGMLALGIWMRRADRQAVAVMAANHRASTIGLVLPFYLILVLRGSLLQAMAFLSVLIICAWWVRSWQANTSGSGGEPGKRGPTEYIKACTGRPKAASERRCEPDQTATHTSPNLEGIQR